MIEIAKVPPYPPPLAIILEPGFSVSPQRVGSVFAIDIQIQFDHFFRTVKSNKPIARIPTKEGATDFVPNSGPVYSVFLSLLYSPFIVLPANPSVYQCHLHPSAGAEQLPAANWRRPPLGPCLCLFRRRGALLAAPSILTRIGRYYLVGVKRLKSYLCRYCANIASLSQFMPSTVLCATQR